MPRCRKCEEKFEQYEFNNKWCKKVDCQTEKALDYLKKKRKEVEKKKKEDWKKYVEKARPISHSKENKATLQMEINKLSKMIDKKFKYYNCIDCEEPLKHIDAGHYIAVGANTSLRYNLHNIHSQSRGCNRNERQGSRNTGYYKGLINRYGLEYAEMVDTGLQKKYEYLGLNGQEIYDKIKVVRKLVKNFESYKFNSSYNARNMLNKIIGIYV